MIARTGTAVGEESRSWEGLPLSEIRRYLEHVKVLLQASVLPESETLRTVDPFAVVGGGKALLPPDLQRLLWGRAPFPRPRKWLRLLEAHRRGVPLPPVILYQTPCGLVCRDGNHRLLLARLLGQRRIRARVFQVRDARLGTGRGR